MAVRRESVRLELDDAGYSTGMAKAAAATLLLDRALAQLDGRQVKVRTSTDDTSQGIDKFRRSADQSGPSIDRLSGRLSLLAQSALVLGPALIPVGAVAVPAITGLASSLGFAAIGMGSLVVATRGVGDALKAVNEAALEPTAANLEKARIAMAGLSPEAREFVTRFQELSPVLSDIRDAAAAGWFPGLTESLDDFERLGPRVGEIFEAIGTAGGRLVAEGADALASNEWVRFLTFVENEGPQALEQFGRSVGNVIHGLAELWMALDPLNDDFSDWLLQASRDFDDWAEGLAQTEGFEEFVDYIQKSGPQVERTLGSIAEAVVAIIKAASPLGGPALAAFETIADTLKLIADSPVGTKIFTMAAAFVLLNKTLAVTAALLARTGIVSAGTAAKIGGAGRGGGAPAGGPAGGPTGGPAGGPTPVPIMARITAARAGFAQLRADVRSLSTTYAGMNRVQSTGLALFSNTTAAAQRTRASLASYGKTIGVSAAGVGAFAIATGALGQGLGLQNTAMLALAGSMAGPWGAAIGAGIGLVADITAANRRWEESLQQINAALASGDSVQIEAANKAIKERLDYLNDLRDTTGFGDFFADMFQTKFGFDIPDQADYDELNFGKLEGGDRLREISASFGNIAAEAGLAADEVEDLRQELANVGTVLTKQGQFDAYKQAIDDLTASVKENGRTLDSNTEKGRANRDALNEIAASAVTYSQNLQGADRIDFLVNARKAFVEGAEKAGGMDKRARAVLKTLNDLIGDYPVSVTATTIGAKQLRELKSLIDSIRSKTVTVTVNRAASGIGGLLGDVFGNSSADGSTVPKDGRPYGDRYPYLLAPGEEVISNRFGQADRHRPLLKAINAGRLAEGGTAGRRNHLPALEFAGLPALNLTTMQLGQLNKALAASTKAVTKETAERDALISASSTLRDNVRDRYRSQLFGGGEWSSGGGIAGATAIANQDSAAAARLKKQIAQLEAKGLDGVALDALLTQGTVSDIAAAAASSRASLAAYERAVERRSVLTASVGSAASSAAYSAEIAATRAQTKALERRLRAIEQAVRQEHKEDRRSNRKGARSAARSNHRGKVRP